VTGARVNRGRGARTNTLLIARRSLEEQLLAGLQEKVLHPDVIAYTLDRFEAELKRALDLRHSDADAFPCLGGSGVGGWPWATRLRLWCFGVLELAGWHPELDRDICRHLLPGTGEPDSRSPAAMHPCADLVGRLQRRPGVVCHPVQ
jgi:hypothetical protein